MDEHRLEELISSINFEPLAPLTDEERAAWDYFQEADMKLRQIDAAKRGVRNAKQKLKNRGQATSVAFTDEERADFDTRTKAVTTRLNALRRKHDARDLENRREYEIHQTRWTLIEMGQWAEDGRVTYCYSQSQLDHELSSCLHTGGVILEVFINRQRLTDEERASFLAEAIQADEDHRAGR
jgi:hypothetical protein